MTHDDERLAAIYDIDNPDGPDHDYFRDVAVGLSAGGHLVFESRSPLARTWLD